MFNLLDYIENATWESNRLETQNRGAQRTSLEYGGGRDNENGFVNLWPNSLSESNRRGDYIVTRPKGGERGSIRGVFPSIRILENSIFHTQVGFLNTSPESSGVVFQLWVHYRHNRQNLSHRVSHLYKERDGNLQHITVDLSFLSNEFVQFELRVDSGNNPNSNDLPIWSRPRVEEYTRLSQPSRYFEIRPTQLAVDRKQEYSGGGDDPFLGLLYFRTSVGVSGSTMVEVLDLLSLLGENLGPDDEPINIDDSAAMVVRDIGFNHGIVTIIGAVFVALEEDKNGRDIVRNTLKEAADGIMEYLINTAERDPAGVLSDFEGFAEGLKNAGQGGDDTSAFKRWIGRGHDLIGINAVTLLTSGAGIDLEQYTGADDPGYYPVGLLENGDFELKYMGEGASWRLNVEVRMVEPNHILSGNPLIER